MKITSLDQVPTIPMSMEGAVNVAKQVPLGKTDGAPNFSFRVFTISPGGNTPYHIHDVEHLNYILQGEGVLVDADGHQHPVKGGDFSMVLPNEKHQYRNSSATEDFKFICAVPLAYE
ncbi:Cupin domain-containing protein [Desulfuromusa kysingii]|uniref:Cupin domain-containing protein n=1 Tax=Desulfuromusa kysingii TaxID=37625 RepID=A0A1H3XDH4_9BACT|nr:cupin domain-containing protein [Desulfuromusa kysingii]SDZ97383.1 Cupin domain-containing protein [Desulfuromusa kysingii]